MVADNESKLARQAVAPLAQRIGAAGVPWLAAIGAAMAASPALAEEWRFVPSVAVTETYTDNSNYGAQGAEQRDWVTALSAGLQINGVGPRARLNGSITLSELYYARHTQANSFAPNVNLVGNIEAIDKFLYIDAQAVVSQTYYSAFGAQPGSLVNGTANRYTSQTYSVSPYAQGQFGGSTVSYQVRDDNIWTVASQYGDTALVDVPSTYLNRLHASVNAPAIPFGWNLVYDGTHYRPTGDNTSASGLENAYYSAASGFTDNTTANNNGTLSGKIVIGRSYIGSGGALPLAGVNLTNSKIDTDKGIEDGIVAVSCIAACNAPTDTLVWAGRARQDGTFDVNGL